MTPEVSTVYQYRVSIFKLLKVSFQDLFLFLFVHMCACEFVYAFCSQVPLEVRKRLLNILELELEAVVSH